MTDPGRLASIRRVDWRFLLPETALGTVAVVGPVDEAVLSGLRQVAARVVGPDDDAASGDTPPADLVVTMAASRAVLDRAVRRVPAGGWIYAGAGPRRASGRASLREVEGAVRAAGFIDVRRSWHWPSEPAALEIVPLDDARAVRLTLDRRRSGRAARVKATMAGVALRLHILERVVPGWSVIGRRPGGATTAASILDPVRASIPDGGGAGAASAAGAAVVLLTPRFRASRHVIGLVLRPADGGLAAVAKLSRLADDDGGIRREAEGLRRAAALGVPGVPQVLALRGAPASVLVESALDGVVIAGHEVRARPAVALAEVEAWTRALAGPASGRPQVSFRTLWAPALERIANAIGPGTLLDGAWIAQQAEHTARILGALDDTSVPTVLEHGDLAPPNLLRLRDGRLGVVDWEVADPAGLPLGDLLFFATFVLDQERADDTGSSASGPLPAVRATVSALAERQAAHLGIDPALIPALRLAMWARWADRQLARFIDPALSLEDRLPARHVRSWTATVTEMAISR